MDVQKVNHYLVRYSGSIIFLVATLVSIILSSQFDVLIWDEAAYLGNARGHLGESYFTEDFRFPLLEWVIAGAWFFSGESILVARIIMSLFTGLLVLSTYLLSTLLISRKLSIYAALIALLNPILLFWSFRIYTDIPALAVTMLGLYFFFKKRYIFSGFLFAAGFLFRFSIILFALPAGIYLLYNVQYKKIANILLGSVILLLPWMTHNVIQYGSPLWDVFAQGQVIATYTQTQPIQLFLGPFMQGFFPLVLGLIGLIFVKRNSIQTILYAGLALQVLLHVFVIRLKLERYLLLLIPLFIILCLQGWNELFKRSRIEIIVLIIAFTLAFQLSAVQSIIPGMEYTATCNDVIEQTNTYLSKYPEGTLVASNAWPLIALPNHHEVRSTWTTNISLLIEKPLIQKIVYIDGKGLPYNQTDLLTHPDIELEKNITGSCNDYVLIFDVFINA